MTAQGFLGGAYCHMTDESPISIIVDSSKQYFLENWGRVGTFSDLFRA